MAAIAGISAHNSSGIIKEMLGKMSHRGNSGMKISENCNTTAGIAWNESEEKYVTEYLESGRFCDNKGAGHCAWAKPGVENFTLFRDELGVAPLYYAWDKDGLFYFSSEVKALVPYSSDIKELKPGNIFNGKLTESYYEPALSINQANENPLQIAERLRNILDKTVKSYIQTDTIGSWLSGGIDSSAICALAARHVRNLKTFAAGLRNAPDLEYAREVSAYLRSEHHEIIVSVEEMVKSLPEVIYHLESFDQLLVRSSITNYLVAKKASQFVSEVFSGEGGDELFAGYEYLKSLPEDILPHELVKITGNLHNTALQRVDRCSSSHGTIAHVPFLQKELVEFAFSIPAKYKLHNKTEKWILRKAMEGYLPDRILNRPKAKFWEGAGVKEIISLYAEGEVTDADFNHERYLKNGWILNSREELLYYRIFREQFGSDLDLEWMGRTENTPVYA